MDKNAQLLAALGAVAHAVDQGREVALEDDGEIAVHRIHLADAEDLGAAVVHRQYPPVGRHHDFTGCVPCDGEEQHLVSCSCRPLGSM